MLGFLVPKVQAITGCAPGAGVDIGNCLALTDQVRVKDVYTNPAFLVNLVVRNVFILAGIVIFFLIILAGYKFLTQDKKGLEEARNILTTAFLGLIFMLSAYWIVQLIAYVTGADIVL
ncbi:hypothetical protein KBC79_05355 [Candidatus Woesebacteria bacterium]|nr:hypothetical protein [Candidatus Woesebacteria bacterium]